MNDSVTTRSSECVFAIGTYAALGIDTCSLRGAIAKTGVLTQTQNISIV